MTPAQEFRVELPFQPYAHQRAAHGLRMMFRFLVLVWHRRGGKTVFAVLELLLAAAACERERGRYGYIAPFLKQAKAVAWDYLKHFTAGIPGCVYNESELSVELPNGAKVRLFGADNPDNIRGLYFDGVVLDEVADMRPNMWGEIIRPALADREGWAIFIGTPKGVNLFSELYYSALQHKAGFEDWKADLKRATDTEVLRPEEIESARAAMSGPQFAQEFECDFAAAVANALIPLNLVLAAQQRTVLRAAYEYAPKILGVDVARYGGDRNVVFMRQGCVAFQPRVWKPDPTRGDDLMNTAGQVAQIIDQQQPDAVFIDQTGLGGGVVDRLRQLGHQVIGVDNGSRARNERFENKRAEMWWEMGKWVAEGACLPSGEELLIDLTAPLYSYANRRGRFELESKDDLRARGMRSPDLGDGLALTFAEPIAIPDPLLKDPRTRHLVPHRGRVVHEYDPFSGGA